MASTKPARGMRDFLPADVRKRNYVINIIKEVYESYGFEPLETPSVENLETLMGKYGDEGNQLVFKILKRGEKLDLEHATKESDLSDLALRYDLTVPLARVVANNKNDLPKFFKRYQIQPVWRADRPARGRFREFYQCDVDAIGSESMVVEAELINAVCEILLELGFNDKGDSDGFVVKVNHRELLFRILDAANVPPELYGVALAGIDKLDKMSVADVSSELLRNGISDNAVAYLMDLYTRVATEWNRQDPLYNNIVLSMILPSDLKLSEELLDLLKLIDRSNVAIYPFLARGLSYYTGAIMEINVFDLAGSLGGGGRYDGLIGMFGKEQIPACGFSLGLERILVVMEERGMFDKPLREGKLKLDSADVMVSIWNEESIPASLKLAAELRDQRLRVLVYPEADKFGKQIKYAKSIGIPFVAVLRDEDIEAGRVKLIRTSNDEEWTVTPAEVGAKVAI